MPKSIRVLKYVLVGLLIVGAFERLPAIYLISSGLVEQDLATDDATYFISKLLMNVALLTFYIYLAYRLMQHINALGNRR